MACGRSGNWGPAGATPGRDFVGPRKDFDPSPKSREKDF